MKTASFESGDVVSDLATELNVSVNDLIQCCLLASPESLEDKLEGLVGESQHLYAIKNLDAKMPLFKIGRTGAIKTRLSALKSQTGCDLRVAFLTKCVLAPSKHERTIHRILAQYRTCGEWFACDESIIANAFESIVPKVIVTDKKNIGYESIIQELVSNGATVE